MDPYDLYEPDVKRHLSSESGFYCMSTATFEKPLLYLNLTLESLPFSLNSGEE